MLLYQKHLSNPVSHMSSNYSLPPLSFLYSGRIHGLWTSEVGFCAIKLPHYGGKIKQRNVLYTSNFSLHKRHIVFPRRQGVQQVLPSLVSGPSPTKSGYLVSDPSSPIRDCRSRHTHLSQQSVCSLPRELSHRTETCDSEGH